jgi:hypothetical protein
VEGLPDWKRHEYEGYKPVVADVTAFWRPSLKKCPSKHYHPAAGRALPAVIFGVVGKVGEINGQRIALPQAFERAHPKDPSEKRLWSIILKNIKKALSADEIVVVDAGLIRLGCWQLLSFSNQAASEIFTKTVGRLSKFL